MSEETEAVGQDRTYEQAVTRLDQIINRLDSGSAELRETLDLCTEAKDLIEFCAGELNAVDNSLKELRLEDLAASLNSSSDGQPADASPEAPATEEAPPPTDDEVPF